ncbi:MAG: 3-keto-5-aminohexanoate cleavage protein [Rhodoplanes sp.]|uniref:3-keto-5-aminohexanoate cleavage protein n=1 Tax=Rhodoplanes sp. TaxID=1968906 RepID=UPI00181533B9|nr:3-keto-5-aminohexanoate cleavage protein [Rhodoplanes sp.]NVO16061.1 3-keto-5-aminohexanoate cleavage protein [Rhodoplanes sp.]NVO16070.1 3-keto-5-aminohexanoate cleavage protein [Rhodoplanes sp.]
MSKLIITAAVTGSVHVPSLSAYLPVTPEEIAADGLAAVRAGAALVHVHARDPKTGKPSADPKLYEEIVKRISAETDAPICITTGGSKEMTVAERARSVMLLEPELASLNTGSMNFAIHPLAAKIKEPKFDWEIPFLQATEDWIFPNTFKTLGEFATFMAKARTKPELEVYDAGMLSNVQFLLGTGVLKAPIHIQFVLGILGGMQASVGNLVFLHESACRMIGEANFTWSLSAAGRAQLPMMATAMGMGGNVRVGLEDNLYLAPKQLAKSSAEQVERIVTIANALSIPVATPAEARQILGLKGADAVGWAKAKSAAE